MKSGKWFISLQYPFVDSITGLIQKRHWPKSLSTWKEILSVCMTNYFKFWRSLFRSGWPCPACVSFCHVRYHELWCICYHSNNKVPFKVKLDCECTTKPDLDLTANIQNEFLEIKQNWKQCCSTFILLSLCCTIQILLSQWSSNQNTLTQAHVFQRLSYNTNVYGA